jgi:hypothetical protein
MTPREAAEEMEKRFSGQTYACTEDVWDERSSSNTKCRIVYNFGLSLCDSVEGKTFEECLTIIDEEKGELTMENEQDVKPIKTEEVLASFFVAGVQFHELKMVASLIKEGDILDLVLEPTNKFDPNAVRIEFQDYMVGFVPKKFSAMISGIMTVEPVTCRVISINMSKKTYEQLFVELTAEAKDES